MTDATPLELFIFLWATAGLLFALWLLATAVRRLIGFYRDVLDDAARLLAWERVGLLAIVTVCLLSGAWLGGLVSLAPADPWPPSSPAGAWAREQLRLTALPVIMILISGYTVVAAWMVVSNWRVDRALSRER